MSSTCPMCGAKTVEYAHALTVPLVRGLVKLAALGGGPVNLTEVGLTRNQWDNFQKLRYWNLVAQTYRDGKRVGGTWEITDAGRAFLAGERVMPRRAWTYRGKTVRFEGPDVSVGEVDALYQQREQWADEAVAHAEGRLP